jgi:hypothetical protein
VGLAFLAPSLVACDEPNTAASVGPTVFTEDQVIEETQSLNALLAVLEPGLRADTQLVFQVMLADAVAAEILAQSQYPEVAAFAEPLTEEGLAAILEDEGLPAETFEGVSPLTWMLYKGGRQYYLYQAVSAGLTTDAELEAVLSTVKVNPRYGTAVADSLGDIGLVPVERPWLITEAELTAESGETLEGLETDPAE